MATDTIKDKAEFITERHIQFLEDLRDSCAINMMGAAPYLQEEFGCSSRDAHKILFYWMKTC
jgi:hypothetical protein